MKPSVFASILSVYFPETVERQIARYPGIEEPLVIDGAGWIYGYKG